jgi:HAMP domain-containing protein
MLVICEDCAKKYNIDESRIKGKKAKFTCKECGHIIVVEKPEAEAFSPESKPISDQEAVAQIAAMELSEEQQAYAASAPSGKGTRIGAYIMVTMITGFLLVSGAFAYLYLTFIPEIINNQIELRTQAVTQAFSGIIKKPLLLRHYLQVNKEAQRISKVSGVAYAAVVNKKGIVIAGFFSDLNRFDSQFVEQVKKQGFPKDVLAQNKLLPGMDGKHVRIVVGGQKLVDQVAFIPDTESEVHVGVYVSEVDDAIRNALVSPLTLSLFGAVILVGLIMLLLLSKLIAKPMRELTDIANRISFGQLDLVITPRGPREMRELATAFERMRFSIKAAMDRLRK